MEEKYETKNILLNKKRKPDKIRKTNRKVKSKFLFKKRRKFNENNINTIAFMKGETAGLSFKESRNIVYNNCISFYNLKKINIKDLYFEESRITALKYINKIDSINNKDELIEIIYRSLSYDNVNQLILFRALSRLHSLKYYNECVNLIKEYKYILSKELIIKDNNNLQLVNLDDLNKIDNIFIVTNENQIKKILIRILEILMNISYKSIYKYNKIKSLLEIKYKYENEHLEIIIEKDINNNTTNTFDINEDNNKDKDIDIKKDINEFKTYYKDLKATKTFNNNQPIDYYVNNILYYNVLINTIFKIILEEEYDKDNNILKITFIYKKLKQINLISDFINKIIKQLQLPTSNENINEIFKLFIFLIESKFTETHNTFNNNIYFHNEENKPLTKDFFDKYINAHMKSFKELIENIKIFDNKFVIYDQFNKEIIFEYNKYPESLMNKIQEIKSFDEIYSLKYKTLFFNEFQKENFFDKKEIEYLKIIIKSIINSKFFEELYILYSESNSLPDDIIKDAKIQNYIIENISFYPFDEKELDTQALTLYQNAHIIISGFPFIGPGFYINESIHHILELARKVIQLIHEYMHALKKYLSIVTNSLILFDTINEENVKVEAGYLLEYIMFGWSYKNYNDNNKIYDGNSTLKNKEIDVSTALKILNPNLYNHDINSVKNILYNNFYSKEYISYNNKKNIDDNFKKYLEYLGYNSEEKIVELEKDKSKISVARKTQIKNIISADFKCGNDKTKYEEL